MNALSAACLILAAIFSTGSAKAQSVEAFKKLCVEEVDLQKRVDACTAALESEALSEGGRSFALAMRGGAYIIHIGHKAALAKDSATAKTALTNAIGICGFRGFEFHAAKKWLKALGG